MSKRIYKRTKPAWNKGTKGLIKPNSGSFKKGHIPVTKRGQEKACLVCGKKRFYKPSYLKRGYGNYCSLKCSGSVRKGVEGFNKGRRFPQFQGENHPLWKGEQAGYIALHAWVKRYKGKANKCIECGSSQNVEWANKSYEYKRNLTDWVELCSSCHSKRDRKNGWKSSQIHFDQKGHRIKQYGKTILSNKRDFNLY